MTPNVNPPNNPILGRINFTERQECPCARCSAHRKQWADYAESVAAPGNAEAANAAMNGLAYAATWFGGARPIVDRPVDWPETDEQAERKIRELRAARNVAPMRGLFDAPSWIDDEEPAPAIPRPLRNLVWFLFGAALVTVAAVVMEIVAEVVK